MRSCLCRPSWKLRHPSASTPSTGISTTVSTQCLASWRSPVSDALVILVMWFGIMPWFAFLFAFLSAIVSFIAASKADATDGKWDSARAKEHEAMGEVQATA